MQMILVRNHRYFIRRTKLILWVQRRRSGACRRRLLLYNRQAAVSPAVTSRALVGLAAASEYTLALGNTNYPLQGSAGAAENARRTNYAHHVRKQT